MPFYEMTVTLHVSGPVVTRSSVPSRWGIDAPPARDAIGRCILPWTLVKGLLAESWRTLLALGVPSFQPALDDLLGEATGTGSARIPGLPPRRGRLRGADFLLTTAAPRGVTLYRIQVDDERGAAQTGMYQVIESPLARGEHGAFTGTIGFESTDPDEPRRVARWLDKGLRFIPAVGAFDSVGFGALESVDLTDFIAGPSAANAGPERLPSGALSLALLFDRPFEVSRTQPNANLFESLDIVPGGVLKGALASTWAERIGRKAWEPVAEGFDPDRPDLSRAFEQIRFGHAFPEGDEGRRPLVVPLSAVFAKELGNDALFDAALADRAGLLHQLAPAFAPDWKDEQIGSARATFGWPSLSTELRVRTAIKDGVAAPQQLFAYQSVVPGTRRWLFDIDFSAAGDDSTRERVAAQLVSLLFGGLRGIGKTKANAKVALLLGAPSPAWAEDDGDCRLYVLTLQADAILFDAAELTEEDDDQHLERLYSAYFDDMSAGALRMVRYFARQHLAGGWYLHERFQHGKPYHPLALTDAGSVFVLKTEREGDAANVIAVWRARGLPIPKAVDKSLARSINGQRVAGSDWRNCPYVPQNGWGAVAVNLSFHEEKRVDQDEGFVPTTSSPDTEVAK